MIHVRSRWSATGISSDPSPRPYSDHMLAELLAMHEEMIVQLRLERLGVASSADFLTGLIDQHETAVALLRAQFENAGADAAGERVISLPRPARSATQPSPAPRFARGVRAPCPASP